MGTAPTAALAAAIALALAGHARADPSGDCAAAAAAAEREQGLPEGILLAIGKVESGRESGGQVMPWPWTINAAGTGRWLGSAAEAAAAVRDAQGSGIRSIDVGCFQVNLQQHPDAFATVEDGLDPMANARYAAAFLASLRRRAGSIGQAVAWYHSATPWLGEPYAASVLARMGGTPEPVGEPGPRDAPARPAPGRDAGARPQPALAAFGIAVWERPGATAAAVAQGCEVIRMPGAGRLAAASSLRKWHTHELSRGREAW